MLRARKYIVRSVIDVIIVVVFVVWMIRFDFRFGWIASTRAEGRETAIKTRSDGPIRRIPRDDSSVCALLRANDANGGRVAGGESSSNPKISFFVDLFKKSDTKASKTSRGAWMALACGLNGDLLRGQAVCVRIVYV